MNKRIRVLVVLCISIAAPALVSAQEEGRGVLFQIGAGAGFPSYPSETEALLSYIEESPGIDRVKMSLDLALGFAVSQQSYLMLRSEGIGDRLTDSIDYIQMNLLLYSLGLRYYPSTTGIYLEAGAGGTKAVVQYSSGSDDASDFGFGFGAALGYDFNAKPRGFGLTLEARYLGLTIEEDQAGGLMLTLNLCWK